MKILRITLGIVISIVLLAYVFHENDWSKVAEAVKNADILWLPLAIVIYFAGIWVRTIRWKILMAPIKACTTGRLFPVYIISYMANNILPLRIGDIYRAYIIGKKESISKSASLVTIGVERLFDGLTMLILLSVAVFFYPVGDPIIGLAIRLGTIFFLSALLIAYFVVLNRTIAQWFFNHLVLRFAPEKWHEKLIHLLNNFYTGLGSLKGFKAILSVVVLSLITWLIEAASYMVVLFALGYFGDFHVSVMTMALVNLMIIVPAAPGYFGPFEFACVIVLGGTGYGIFTKEAASAYAIVLHVIVQWIPSTLLGMFYMWKEHLTFKEIKIEDVEKSE